MSPNHSIHQGLMRTTDVQRVNFNPALQTEAAGLCEREIAGEQVQDREKLAKECGHWGRGCRDSGPKVAA